MADNAYSPHNCFAICAIIRDPLKILTNLRKRLLRFFKLTGLFYKQTYGDSEDGGDPKCGHHANLCPTLALTIIAPFSLPTPPNSLGFT